MYVREYRIVMPLTVDEYMIGQLYAVAHHSLNETGGGEGIEVLKNEPFRGLALGPRGAFTKGQYTKKIYYLANKVPWWIRKFAPKKSLIVVEEAWNAYPYCKTVAKSENKDYTITIESMHLADSGTTENALELSSEKLGARRVEFLDIAKPLVCAKDYKPEHDPTLFVSAKTDRGPLMGDWAKSQDPIMCCYKVVTIDISGWPVLRGRIQKSLAKEHPRIFQKLHRQMFCTIDLWHDMSLEEIRALEAKTKDDLDKQRQSKSIKGTKGGADD